MDFQELVAKMQAIDTTQNAPVETKTDECGMPPMAPNMPAPEPKDKASMTININAQGDAIQDVMDLLNKMKDNDKPSALDMPTMSIMPPMAMDEPEGPPMPKPINKLIPDFDGDNDDMPGGEKDMIDIKALGDKDDDADDDMEKLHKTVDRDNDGDHDMDDHDAEKDEKDDEDDEDKEEAWANEPDEDERSVHYQMNKLQGGMNRRKGTHPKVAGADNPMQRVKEGEDLRATIKAQLQKALAETKGAK